MWCVAELNEAYLTRMEEVLATYERPYDPAEPVVCLDEKPVTLHADVRPARAAGPGREARRDNEYQRCGKANVFCAVEPKAGRHFTFPTPNRCGGEFAQMICELARHYPSARTIHLVVDNLNIHHCKSLTDHYGREVGSKLWQRFHSLHPHSRQLAQPGGNRNRAVRAPVPGPAQNPRPQHPAAGSPCLGSPHQSGPDPDQLALRPSGCPP